MYIFSIQTYLNCILCPHFNYFHLIYSRILFSNQQASTSLTSSKMAEDFFKHSNVTQRANIDITKDLAALELPTTDPGFGSDHQSQDEADPLFQRAQTVTDDIDGFTLDSILSGYAINADTLHAIDECLLIMCAEEDFIADIVKEEDPQRRLPLVVSQTEDLLNKKCPKAVDRLRNYLIDAPGAIYDHLFRLACKIKQISLITNNQKMIYVPVMHNICI